MFKALNLLEAFAKVEALRNSNMIISNLAWENYDFGKNFYLNVFRDEEQTELETAFIANKLRLKANSKILDLGCGGGRNSFALTEKSFEVIGVDLNKYAIEQAGLKKNKKATFIHQNILDIDYEDEFNAVILVFNHFSALNILEAKKLLKKIEKALVREGKLLIEIPSIYQGFNLDRIQEWHILNTWLAGDFEQLVLVENTFEEKKKIHLRKDYCLNLETLELYNFTQVSQLYEIEELHNLFRMFNLKLTQTYGNWEGKIFEEGDETLIIVGEK